MVTKESSQKQELKCDEGTLAMRGAGVSVLRSVGIWATREEIYELKNMI